jgi:cobalt-zinc-cadmium efflux system membrane fusion protein
MTLEEIPMPCPMPSNRWTRRACIALLALAAPCSAFAQASAPAPAAALLACLILPDKVADLGSPVIGVVESVAVDRGDLVRKGQVLATLRAEVERANTSVVRSRADSEADLRGATAGRDLAQQRLDRARSLATQNFVSAQAVEQAESEFRIAHERMAQARDQLGTSAREVSSARAQLAQRVLRSPFDGVITERYVNPGERVEDKPLLKLAMIQQLRVELVASTTLFGTLRVGQELSVQPDLAGAPARRARIAQIDRVLEPASNTFRLRLELPNADHGLPAGLRCKAALPQAAAAVASR